MTPEASLYLAKAHDLLNQAEVMVGVKLFEAAGRTAYLAGFQAAQALLFEKTGKVFKTHKGVQGEFGRLVKDDPRMDLELRAFLGRTYDLKTIADYESGPGTTISAAQATEAVATAQRFVVCVAVLIDEER